MASDFHIELEITSNSKNKKLIKQKYSNKTKFQIGRDFEKWESYCIRILSEYLHLLEEWKVQFAPTEVDAMWDERFIEACKRKEIINYYLDILFDGELNDRIKFLSYTGEKVKKLKNDWSNIDKETAKKMEQAIQTMESDMSVSTMWFDDGQIDEVAFCEWFLRSHPLKCINGIFFGLEGMMMESEVEKEVYRLIKSVLTKGVSKKVKQLVEC